MPIYECTRCGQVRYQDGDSLPEGWGLLKYIGRSGFEFAEIVCDECYAKRDENNGKNELQ